MYHQSPNLQPGGERRSGNPHSGYESDEDWDTNSVGQASSGSPLSKEGRSGGLDSGIGSRATSPSSSEQKTEEPPSSCVDSSSTAQVNNVNPVNSGVQNSPITETPVDTKEQNNSGSAGSCTNEKDNESGLDSDAENELKERAARIEREQAERREKQERQKEVNSEVKDLSTLPFKDCCRIFGGKALRYQKENVALGPRVL